MAKRSRIDMLIAELEGKRNVLNAQIDVLMDARVSALKPVRKSKVSAAPQAAGMFDSRDAVTHVHEIPPHRVRMSTPTSD